jgi:hypothetical protein
MFKNEKPVSTELINVEIFSIPILRRFISRFYSSVSTSRDQAAPSQAAGDLGHSILFNPFRSEG